MRHVAMVAIVAGLGVAGCAHAPMEGLASDKCDGQGKCRVTVSVADCKATPSVDPLPVTAKNVNISWELNLLSGLSYQFREKDGVELKMPSAEFAPRSTGSNKKYMLHDKNSLPGTHQYPYRFNIQKAVIGGYVDCPQMDPTIVNQG